ncbi:hypothetical protein RUM43_003662 [Polyplax serrata]|uniref:Active breakpoint cluster region-related protein n=1 Tax=Polyplax serrata TaxID=468196 RepID=A0AAN8S5N9_POLSC
MSVYCDFRKVWMERFPDSELPAAWEEDVRSNLMKHRQQYKQRVTLLKEELEKEEFYVEYLEHLLADVEKQKTRAAGDGEAAGDGLPTTVDDPKNNFDETETSNKFSKSCSQNSIDLCISELAECTPLKEKKEFVQPQTERSFSVDDAKKKQEENDEKLIENRQRSLTQPNLSNFITVIEISGKKKVDVPLKCPPKPPPKTFMRLNPDGITKQVESNSNIENDHTKRRIGPSLPSPDVANQETESVLKISKPSLRDLNELKKEFENGKCEPSYGKIKKTSPNKTEDSFLTPNGLNKSCPETVKFRQQLTIKKMEFLIVPKRINKVIDSLDNNKEESESLVAECEPYYDSVPAEDSDGECVIEALTLPSRGSLRPSVAASNANYVNIDYFIKQRPPIERSSSVESEENASHTSEFLQSDRNDFPSLLTGNASDGTYTSNSSLESSGTKVSGSVDVDPADMQKKIIDSVIESETIYLECLNVLLQYMKALKATLSTSQPVISEDELNTVFYKIPELHAMHSSFLEGLKGGPPYGMPFRKLAESLNEYGAFLHNYGRATDTVKRRSQICQQFADITTDIKLKSLQGQYLSLEDLLFKPVARVQKNALVLDDLLKCSSNSQTDQEALKEALSLTKTFLDSFNMIETKKMFGHEDRAQRRLVKNSFMVELCEGHRKLRHLFLFNDVMACAKYKSTGRGKITYVHLNDLIILEETGNEPKEISPPNLLSLKSQVPHHACTMRDQILRDEEKKKSGLEKQRKKLAGLEAQLVLAYPDLVLRVGQRSNRLYTFLLSSEFERTQWIEAVHNLQNTFQQSHLPGPKTSVVSMVELQAWVTACRAFLKTNMGSYLMRTVQDESLLRGDLHVTIGHLQGLPHPMDLFLVLEVDSYGHYFRKARSKLICRSQTPRWDQSFVIDLEGSQNLRVLLYEEAQERMILRGKSTRKLSVSWLGPNDVSRKLSLTAGVTLSIKLRFQPADISLRRIPQNKPLGFGSKIQQVCKREDRNVPFIITSCVREVERRGMTEVGIYRVSGSASDLARLKKSFETNSYEAEQLLKEVCVHSVTGILKLYLRELPEALFTDLSYEKFLQAWNVGEGQRDAVLTTCFQALPAQNRDIINFLLDHLIRVNQNETSNKMSLHNLATVFGPTLLRPSSKEAKTRDLLAQGTCDVMAQAGILHYFLLQKQVR